MRTAAILTGAIACGAGPAVMLATPAPQQLVWRFDGQKHFEEQGLTIHNAGDIDGDGVPDVITGLKTMPSASPGNHISARIYSGKTGALLLEIVAPKQAHDSPNPVASLGDLSGDKRSEFIVGTPDAGVARIFSGTGALLKTLTQPPASVFGASVGAAGDTNGDGVMDLIIGAPGTNSAFVYSGTPANAAGFSLLATFAGDNRTQFGASVGTAGVLGLDKRSAVVIGAPLYGGAIGQGNRGRVYVFRTTNPTSPVFTVTGGGSHDLLGTDVDGGRDIDGDGTPDFMASAIGTDIPPPQGSGQTGTGYVKIFSGKDAGVIATFTSNQVGDLYGFSAELSGQCDGQPTLIVGAPQAVDASNNNAISGRILVYNARTGAEQTQVVGEKSLDGLGVSVGGYVDLTGDGNAEFLVGAHGTNLQPPGIFVGGSAFVYSCTKLLRPDITAAPTPVAFGAVPVNTPHDVVVQLTNQGTAPLHMASVSMAGGSHPSFSVTAPAGPITLAPAGTQNVTVHYTPSTAAVHGGALRTISDDPDHPTYDVPVGGKGQLVDIQVTPPKIDFGALDVNESVGAPISVKNVGNMTLDVSDITLSSPDFSIAAVPPLPKLLGQGQSFLFLATFKLSSAGAKTALITIASNDPASPGVGVPLSGSGVPPNLPPTAAIEMQVPYVTGNTGVTIAYKGDKSFDAPPSPPNVVVSHAWDFAGSTTAQTNPGHFFPCAAAFPCLSVTQLSVTDNGGKSDPTSVTAISLGRPLRSRFYGTIRQGGSNVADGTVVEGWIANKKVAESLTQTHLGTSVFAIEIPPDVHGTGAGGKDGNAVSFRYKLATADQTGTWYSATDQELNLTAPFFVLTNIDWCVAAHALGLEICGPPEPVVPSIYVELQEWPVPPIPDPGPLKTVGSAFALRMVDAVTKRPLDRLPRPFQIRVNYSDRQLAAAGISNERSLGLYYVTNGRWMPAGRDILHVEQNEIVTTLNHTSIFALMGSTR